MARMLSTNVLDNSTDPTTHCYDVSTLFGTAVGENVSLDEAKAYKCSTALIWAKNTGIKQHPEMYVNYTTLSENSSYEDFQCALYHMKGSDELGSGQNCTYPCTSTLPQCPQMGAGLLTNKSLDDATIEPEGGSSGSSGSWPVWGWILLALGILGIIAGIAAMMMGGKKEEKPKKKKRATATKAAPAPASPEVPTPPAMTAPPVYVAAAPTVMTAPPVYLAAPTIQTRAIATPMAMPIQAVAAPMQMATPVATFDQLDRNHDGVITRSEFAAAVGR